MEEVKKELIERFELDQKFSYRKDWVKLKLICKENSEWLKDLIHNLGWLSKKKVGLAGENASWLIIQHSDDLEFKKECLKLLKNLPKTKERKSHIAYLTDSILVKENKKQIYGTQFHRTKSGKFKPRPILDLDDLGKRREDMELESFIKYKKIMEDQK